MNNDLDKARKNLDAVIEEFLQMGFTITDIENFLYEVYGQMKIDGRG